MTILLDPGHGNNTLGKRSPDGHFLEYKFNRIIASSLNAKLISNVILVSIHANAAGNGSKWMNARGLSYIRGLMIWYQARGYA